MSVFFKSELLGELEIDKVFFGSYYPILFTCVNKKREHFLCVCNSVNKQDKKWLIAETTPEVLIDMLSDRITLRDAFLKADGKKVTLYFNNNNSTYTEEKNILSDWDSEGSTELPSPNEYIDAEDGEFLEDVKYYTTMLKKELWLKIPVIGDLWINEIFMYYDEPQLFTCVDKSNRKFLLMLTDEERWIGIFISEEKNENIKKGTISINDAILNPENMYVFRLHKKSEVNCSLKLISPIALTTEELTQNELFLTNLKS